MCTGTSCKQFSVTVWISPLDGNGDAHTERPPPPRHGGGAACSLPVEYVAPASAASRRALSSRPSSAATHAVDTVRRGYVPVGFQDLFVKLRDDDTSCCWALKTLSLTLDMATNQLEKECSLRWYVMVASQKFGYAGTSKQRHATPCSAHCCLHDAS